MDKRAELGWLKHLPEVGYLAKEAEREEKLLQEISELGAALQNLRATATAQAGRNWSAEEIKEAHAAEKSERPLDSL